MLGASEGILRTALLLADGGKEKVIEACVELAKSAARAAAWPLARKTIENAIVELFQKLQGRGASLFRQCFTGLAQWT